MNPLMNALRGMGGSPFGNVQAILQRAQQLSGMFQNPEQLVQQFFPYVPAEMRNDPDKILKYLVDNGKISQQQIDQIKQSFPRK